MYWSLIHQNKNLYNRIKYVKGRVEENILSFDIDLTEIIFTIFNLLITPFKFIVKQFCSRQITICVLLSTL